MRLRNRLLIAFATVALIVVVIFGTVAYRIAVESANTQELVLMQGFAENKARYLRDKLTEQKSPTDIAALLNAKPGDAFVNLLFDTAGRLVSPPPFIESMDQNLELPKLIGGEAPQPNGRLNIGQQEYVWAAAKLPGTAYTLVLLHRSGIDSIPPYQTIGVRLLITGGIIIWVAVWGALILSSIISKRLKAQDAILLHQAMHDALTGLPNRTLLHDRLQQAIFYSRRDEKSFALLVADLNGFKEINDTLGHQSGDLLLRQVGPRLKGVLRESDTIARLGGDEFAILLLSAGAEEAFHCAQKVTEALEQPFVLNKLNIQVGASIGIALYPDHGQDPDTIVRHTDVAMYQAKHNNRDFALYAPDSDPHSVRRLTLMSDLRQAIDQGELVLYYQPIIHVANRSVVGAEALVRWHHPQHGLIYPDDFIPMAEQTGQIKSLTHWVIQEAIRQIDHWQRDGIHLHVALNLSVRSLHDRRLPLLIDDLLEKSKLRSSSIILEITESAVMADPENAMTTLNELNALGCQLSIDDFGTGFTSLAYLKQLPVKELKIDRSFIMNMCQDDNDAVLVRSIIDLAHNMGRRVVAEGVENKDIWDILEILGCDVAQGYYMGRPVPAREFEHWMRESNWKPATSGKVTALTARARRGRRRDAFS